MWLFIVFNNLSQLQYYAMQLYLKNIIFLMAKQSRKYQLVHGDYINLKIYFSLIISDLCEKLLLQDLLDNNAKPEHCQ